MNRCFSKSVFVSVSVVPALTAVLAFSARPASAATLSAVPMQGGMVMPMVSYSAADGRINVMLDPTIPQLTPLLVSNPADTFAAEDPWYSALDPRAQGLAFSRRYGFVMATMTDPLPDGARIWLRKLSGPAEIGAYRYANTDPKAFEPIFGTAGSPAAMAWNGMMFHPTFTAPAGTHSYSATFDAYLADAAGAEIANSSSGAFTLTWTTVPDGRPQLNIASKVVIAWPPTSGNFVLEVADNLPASNWTPVGVTPVTLDGQPTVLLDPSASTKIYRLRATP
ncbi:MAG: hypothetical protein IT581_08040 [Verrucomicrobiales bacterium]|nr:hypothetical protein [Verrucomicrobiales bacterium]